MTALKNDHIRKNLIQKANPRDVAGQPEEEEEEDSLSSGSQGRSVERVGSFLNMDGP